MKLATLRTTGGTAAARLDGDVYTEIAGYPDLGALLAEENWQEIARGAAGPEHPAAEAELATVVPNPSKVLCVGLNYKSHIQEMGRELPTHPTVFAKFADTLTGPADPVEAVAEDPELDWEGELAIVIGRTAYRVGEAEAGDYIAGYTAANDISMRGWQFRSIEWLQGKIWARSTPVGPVMVTSDEFDPAASTLRTTVNGAVMQEHPISDLLFKPNQLVAYLSTILPLRPGDLILTGTPGGVGRARTPELYLKAGDRVEVSVDGIGVLSTPITEPAHLPA
ncbi:fumarylacetoacetate hydrolase family protein [Arthrobacter sp. I2-34]|uniref:Fumarylacetoacetate hydrolase family protein n=1 Tax=Arthrobacter hankyongi TaxID=2904801 RepID=A0ABS9L3Y8_9MICC|nr:fumarylacetoacetate hydrolase family protein [Arthrobacter hankyongi]MCG2621406.1 fumarylacetoacetate hydrolase family protein [Arthrobacter hankyongi]